MQHCPIDENTMDQAVWGSCIFITHSRASLMCDKERIENSKIVTKRKSAADGRTFDRYGFLRRLLAQFVLPARIQGQRFQGQNPTEVLSLRRAFYTAQWVCCNAVVLAAYLDETNVNGDQRVPMVAGYIASTFQWRRFSEQCDKILRRSNVPVDPKCIVRLLREKRAGSNVRHGTETGAALLPLFAKCFRHTEGTYKKYGFQSLQLCLKIALCSSAVQQCWTRTRSRLV
jgi:hypothetical protein